MYEMELDGVVQTGDGYQQTNVAQVLLFGKGGLDAGVDHTVVSGWRAWGREDLGWSGLIHGEVVG